MLTSVDTGAHSIRGVSLGGIYTSMYVKQLDVLLDCGMPFRSFAGARALFLSHGHADHAGALNALIGVRMLCCGNRKLKVFLPAQIVSEVQDVLRVVDKLQRFPSKVELIGLMPGDEATVHGDLHVRAFKTFHPVPSLGFLFFRRVKKLRPEFADLPGPEIGRRRRAGDDLFDVVDRLDLAYATDTLPTVLDATPELLEARTLILECTFLDDRKSVELAHKSCHIHLEDLLPRADEFKNEALVLMHFSQIYKPPEVREILADRCPPSMRERLVVFAPDRSHWPG
ncbi:MAG: MBL fold metallo-hydrolase [Pseudomonadota bacterium]